ncbi:response regulator [Bifidobacterium choloepi]|uniref:Response regulator transcription factor n=1 Tax=Bifidobacterium choloepi TaxID=2614131 RepID=A0A6I5NBI3_9BIFI|nr:response regulator [Bifidobacterium choloepi]NEG69850.1 response regulator transcription factor [Bifidobacterium choloepi]
MRRPKLHIAIVEPDDFARQALTALLQRKLQATVRAFRGNEPLILDDLARCGAYQVIVVSMVFDRTSGPAFCQAIRRRNGTTPILGITALPLQRFHAAMVSAGAQGLASKTAAGTVIRSVLAMASGMVMPDFRMPELAHARICARQEANDPVLTAHDCELLHCFLFYKADLDAMSQELGISRDTVRKSMKRLQRKLKCRSSVELYCYALDHEHYEV